MSVLLVCEMDVGKKDGGHPYSVGCGLTQSYDYHYWYFDVICSRAPVKCKWVQYAIQCWMNIREYGSMS